MDQIPLRQEQDIHRIAQITAYLAHPQPVGRPRVFNLWGSADILNAFYQAHAGLLAGQLGAAFFLPTVIVPLLLITHGLAFRILLQHQPKLAMQGSRHLASGRSDIARGAIVAHSRSMAELAGPQIVSSSSANLTLPG